MTNKDKNQELLSEEAKHNRSLLSIEYTIGAITLLMFFVSVFIASFADMTDNSRLFIIVSSTIFVALISLVLLKIEQIAGYYKCDKCQHTYIPSYKLMFFAPHFGRTRYLKCPECGKKSFCLETHASQIEQ